MGTAGASRSCGSKRWRVEYGRGQCKRWRVAHGWHQCILGPGQWAQLAGEVDSMEYYANGVRANVCKPSGSNCDWSGSVSQAAIRRALRVPDHVQGGPRARLSVAEAVTLWVEVPDAIQRQVRANESAECHRKALSVVHVTMSARLPFNLVGPR